MFDYIWLYHCGYIQTPLSMLLQGEDLPRGFVKLPFMALAAYHEEHGVVLVDAPYGHDGPKNMGSLLGSLIGASLMKFEPSWSVIPRLEQMGLRSSQVNHILMTHMHYDHTGGMKELGHATFHLSREEWNDATTIGPLDGLMKGYAISDYRALHARMNTFDNRDEYDRHDEGIDLFGDGSVMAITLPGHTRGHMGYRFKLRDGRTIFHVGDSVYDLRQLTHRYGMGSMARRVSHDLPRAAFTMSELQRYHQENPEVMLVCTHDIGLGERCMHRPIKL